MYIENNHRIFLQIFQKTIYNSVAYAARYHKFDLQAC
jgi:hypothetical protein